MAGGYNNYYDRHSYYGNTSDACNKISDAIEDQIATYCRCAIREKIEQVARWVVSEGIGPQIDDAWPLMEENEWARATEKSWK